MSYLTVMALLTAFSFNKDFRYLPLICRGNKACGLFLKPVLQADYALPAAAIQM